MTLGVSDRLCWHTAGRERSKTPALLAWWSVRALEPGETFMEDLEENVNSAQLAAKKLPSEERGRCFWRGIAFIKVTAY